MEVVILFTNSRNLEEIAHDMARRLKLPSHVHFGSRAVIHDDRVRFSNSQTGVTSQRGDSHQLRVDSINGFFFQLQMKWHQRVFDYFINTKPGFRSKRSAIQSLHAPLEAALFTMDKKKMFTVYKIKRTLHKTSDMAIRPSASVFPMRIRTPAREVIISSDT